MTESKRFMQTNFLSRTLLPSLLCGLVVVSVFSLPAYAQQDMRSLVNKANEYANAEQYDKAIPLYEQAVKKAPADAQLTRNLGVIYVNYGVTLQNERRYEEAESYFDKALKLSKENYHAQKSLASSYFYRAMDSRDSGSKDYEQMTTLLLKAKKLVPEEREFDKALGAVYFDQGDSLAVVEKFGEAIPYLEQAVEYDPNQKVFTQSLANVYIAHSRTLPMHSPEQEMLLDKALIVHESPDIIDYVARVRASDTVGPVQENTNGYGEFGALSNGKKALPASATRLTLSDMLLDVENALGNERDASQSMTDRVDTLEKQVFGKIDPDTALAKRVQNLYAEMFGAPANSVATVNPNDVFQGSVDTYLPEVLKVTDGKIVRWGNFPIRVYIDEPSEKDQPEVAAQYKESYREAVVSALDSWKAATNDQVGYIVVKNPQAADIEIWWKDEYVDRFVDPETAPDFYKEYSPPQKTKLLRVVQLASMLTPGYFGLAPQALGAALQYKEYKKLDVLREESVVSLGMKPLRDLGEEQALVVIQNMAAKEYGHALGLKAVSDQREDLLYPELPSDRIKTPSPRDIQTLAELYARQPDILLSVPKVR